MAGYGLDEIVFRGVSLSFMSGDRLAVVMRVDDETVERRNNVSVDTLAADLDQLVGSLAAKGLNRLTFTKITLTRGYLLYSAAQHGQKKTVVTIELNQ